MSKSLYEGSFCYKGESFKLYGEYSSTDEAFTKMCFRLSKRLKLTSHLPLYNYFKHTYCSYSVLLVIT